MRYNGYKYLLEGNKMTEKWNPEQIENLIVLCKDNKTIYEMTNILNKSRSSISNKINRMGIKYNSLKDRWTEEEICFLKENYKNGDSNKMTNFLNRSWGSIKSMATKLNLHMDDIYVLKKPKNRFVNLLEDSNECFYWIGFLLADGCFDYNRKCLSLEICKKDEEHINRFVKFLDYKKNKTYRRNNVCISGSDVNTIPLVCDKFYIKNNKTENPPLFQNYYKFEKDKLLSLIIGFIDGDGNIRKHKGCNSYQITLENHINWDKFQEQIEVFIYNYFGLKYMKSHQRVNIRNYTCLTICNKDLIFNIRSKIDELNIPYMKRKWSIIK